MNVTREKVSEKEVKLTIEVTNEEMQPFLITSAKHISEHTNIPGFRKGHATLDAVVNQVGEMRVLEEAVEPIVRMFYIQAAEQENLDSVTTPQVDIVKMVPGSDLVFTAIVVLMPEIKKLGDFKKLSIDAKATKVEDADIEKAIAEITRMQTKEIRVEGDHAVGEEHLAVIDLNLKNGGVPLEGGQALGFRIYMSEDSVIPGIKEGVMGMKEGAEKTFAVLFPEDHYQKSLAGKNVDAEVKLKEIYKLDKPEADDEFAKSIGLKSMDELKEKITENLKKEQEDSEKSRQERDMLELLANKTKFDEIPEALINDELDKMTHELEHSVEQQGGKFSDYLGSLGKSVEDLHAGWQDQAVLRVKVALVLREVANVEGIDVTDEDVSAEIEKQVGFCEGNDKMKEQVETEQYRGYMRHRMRNQEVIKMLREVMVKQA